jgi:hypothetical protein
MTECTVHQAAEAFIGHLRESGKKERTLLSRVNYLVRFDDN